MDKERLKQIKQYTISNKDKQGDRYIVMKDDLHFVIEEAERLQAENEILKSYLNYVKDELQRHVKGIEHFLDE